MKENQNIPSRIEEPIVQEVPPKASERTKNFFIRTVRYMLRASFTIHDESKKVILKGENLISQGKEPLLMLGFVGGVFLPFLSLFILPFFGFYFIIDIIPNLFFVFILWAIGYTIVYNLLFSRFRFTYKFQDANGIPFGELKGNMSMSRWKIIDPQGTIQATLRFPRLGKQEFFTLDTPEGQYTAYYKYKNHLGGRIRSVSPEMFKEIEVMDSNGVLAFTILNYGQVVQSEEVLSSLITLLSGTCVIARLQQQKLQMNAS